MKSVNERSSTLLSNESTPTGLKGARKPTRPMGILIRTDGVMLNENLRQAVQCKIGRVRQYARGALGARVQLVRVPHRRPDQYRVHVLYEVAGRDVSAEHRAHDPIAALDHVAEKIERRLRKRKTAALAGRVRDHRNGRSRHNQLGTRRNAHD